MGPYILVIDQSTTSSRAYVFDTDQRIVGTARMDVTQHYPQAAWVEQVAEEIWATCLWACKAALRKAGITAAELGGIGIANQRATTIIWERATGRAVANAIVWRDQRTEAACDQLNAAGHGTLVSERTGLLIHPFFRPARSPGCSIPPLACGSAPQPANWPSARSTASSSPS
jgi:glycerol kinase